MNDLLKICGPALLLLFMSPMLFAEDFVPVKEGQVSSLPDDPSVPKLKITVRFYPDKIQFGDSVYVICTFENVDDKVIEGIPRNYQLDFHDFRSRHFQCAVLGGLSYDLIYENLPEDFLGIRRRYINRSPFPAIPLLPGEKRVIYLHTFEFPPLEDIYHPYWLKVQRDFTDSNPRGNRYKLRFETDRFYMSYQKAMERVLIYPSFWIHPRSEKEMEFLEQWYFQCRKEHLPLVGTRGDSVPAYKLPYEKRGTYVEFPSDDGNRVTVGVNEYTPWLFMRTGNRKPPAHLAPSTWQGWKELEENISPSTMRDEIRLTRILIQYCDTKDEKVLDELKDWFAGMNEVQRVCMAKALYERARYDSDASDVRVSLGKVYRVIREYDITANPEREPDWLKKLGLLE